MKIPIELIRPSPNQPRLLFELEKLAEEIKKDGLLSELIVRKKGKFYELIDGERRYRVLKDLRWKKAPVKIVNSSEAKARLLIFKLNKMRLNYSVEEEARFLKKLNDEGMMPQEISEQLRMGTRWVIAHLDVFKFSEKIQKAVWAGQIGVSHVAALRRITKTDNGQAEQILSEVISRKLTVAETRVFLKGHTHALSLPLEANGGENENVLISVAESTPLSNPYGREAMDSLNLEAIQQRGSIEKQMDESSLQETISETVKQLRERLETLQREKITLLEKKEFLVKALSFKCPHCARECVMYRKGDSYWVK